MYMSDGESNDPQVTQDDIDSITADGITIISIGVGSKVLTDQDLIAELDMIASSDDMLYYIDEYDALDEIYSFIKSELCIR